ncbi:hypothetical protein Cylst_6005 [Cylindrospermum stagnale PCC 7417]|uniref:Uncharacterized protein n=1 Tax=Cylindrospermum stagnale PCC 7417 TaxID=56107 RepID=K9X640_9NOST|nr:hypothetical protein Cylst_6005 [Cylindrospermum stagnale PCC 7417]
MQKSIYPGSETSKYKREIHRQTDDQIIKFMSTINKLEQLFCDSVVYNTFIK